MAYAQDVALIGDVQAAASSLGVASTWASGAPVRVKDDFLYEMHLLFRVLKALSPSYTIVYHPGAGAKKHEFPKSPAAKAGRPRFDVVDRETGNVIVQVCAGTRASDSSGRERGLDLSFQMATATDTPNHADVLQIFDAKYRSDSTNRITHPEFAGFAHWVDLFNLRSGVPVGLNLGVLARLGANCLITNGRTSTEEDGECIRVSVREVSGFFPGSAHHTRP